MRRLFILIMLCVLLVTTSTGAVLAAKGGDPNSSADSGVRHYTVYGPMAAPGGREFAPEGTLKVNLKDGSFTLTLNQFPGLSGWVLAGESPQAGQLVVPLDKVSHMTSDREWVGTFTSEQLGWIRDHGDGATFRFVGIEYPLCLGEPRGRCHPPID